jgi:DNA-binding NtrC family response regulator
LRSADQGDKEGFGGLLGTSPSMQQLFEQIRRVAPFKSNVLISGESGTGKELVSRAIHVLSPYCNGPFIAINCSALPRDLVESQLFGHEKGAFTGASARHQGFFEAANGGTLFLDKISELPLESQAKLLRVLESRQVMRLGSTSRFEVNVRLLAATNDNLQQAVDEDRFREDLFYRINVLRIMLPPLRERSEDIPLLVRIFLDQFASDNDVDPRPIDPQVIEQMQRYDWPGNVRELKNMCERLAVMARAETIQLGDLPPEFSADVAASRQPTAHLDALAGMSLEDIEKAVITRTLEQTNGNRTRSAATLGISLRTLQRKIKEYSTDSE